jgi:potassium-transporting ATPase KdpC subunit
MVRMNLVAQIRPALVLFLVLTLITGIFYPFMVTTIAQLAFPRQANGSLLVQDAQAVGSELIGQSFDQPRYFWGRPSATSTVPYNAFDAQTLSASSGSNLGPLSAELVRRVQTRVDALKAADPGNQAPIPVDLVTASGSGLDPHISVAAAHYQVPRVARARGLSQETVSSLVKQSTEGHQFGILGEPRVNVLKLNLALDALK